MRFARRTAHLKPEGAYEVLARANYLESLGRDIIHLEIGQPDFETFENISKAGIQAILAGHTRYTPPSGMVKLKEVVAAYAQRRLKIEVEPDQVVISPGAKPNLFFPTLALIENGDEVLYPDPGFPTYEAMIRLAGGTPVPVPLVEESGFSFDLDIFDDLVSKRTRMVILNSPSNPTGGVIPKADLVHIAAAADRHDFWVMSDEIYSRIVYDDIHVDSIASIDGMRERTIVVDGFSKTYAMTGWRLGYGIMPKDLASRVGLLLTHSSGSTAHFTQFAGIEALTGPQDDVSAVVSQFQERRDVVVEGLNEIPGVRCIKPQGAFYAFPHIGLDGKTSSQIANILLNEAGVAVLPGSAFGENGEGYLRLSYANSLENIKEALRRMAEVLQ